MRIVDHRHRILAVVLFVALPFVAMPSVSFAESNVDGKEIRLLWLGSSSTYYQDMPHQMAEWLDEYGCATEAVSDLAGKSGTGVQKYLEPDFKPEYGLEKGQTVLDKICDGNYDFVVLQVPVDFLAGAQGNDSETFDKAIDIYSAAAKKAGSRVILYEQGWGDGEIFETGQKMLRDAAGRNDVPIAPCRTAWEHVRKEHPVIELHDLPDRVHPGMVGTYLNLCCFYAAITGESPVGLPVREIEYWPLVMKDGKRKRDRSGALFTVNDNLAEYFQKTAWKSWLEVQKDLTK